MSREQFFDWAEQQDWHYEFDGFEPVAMARGTIEHSRICGNLSFALRSSLRGKRCWSYGFGAGLATIGDAVRYPDAIVTCTEASGLEHIVPEPVVVFEVLNSGSGPVDRIVKLREYRAVASIRRYMILEYKSIGLTMLSRGDGQADWNATTLTAGDTLPLPEIGVEIPVSELYEDVALPTVAGA